MIGVYRNLKISLPKNIFHIRTKQIEKGQKIPNPLQCDKQIILDTTATGIVTKPRNG